MKPILVLLIAFFCGTVPTQPVHASIASNQICYSNQNTALKSTPEKEPQKRRYDNIILKCFITFALFMGLLYTGGFALSILLLFLQAQGTLVIGLILIGLLCFLAFRGLKPLFRRIDERWKRN
jgi:hypothetical protein